MRAKQLVTDIERLGRELESAKNELRGIQARCQHQWSEPERKVDRREGFMTKGDPPGTMGVDWQGPMFIPPETKVSWVRHCPLCELTETTTRTEVVRVVERPKF